MPVQISVDASGLRDLAGRFRSAASATPNELRDGLSDLGHEVEQVARAEAPVKTGKLRSSITSRSGGGGGTASVTIAATAPYAAAVHEGSRSHVIRPHGKFLRFVVGGRTVFARQVNHPGTKPNKFLTRAADKANLASRARKIAARITAHL